jgi:hypothetical protein
MNIQFTEPIDLEEIEPILERPIRKVQCCVCLEPELIKKLKAVAKLKKATKSAVVNAILRLAFSKN